MSGEEREISLMVNSSDNHSGIIIYHADVPFLGQLFANPVAITRHYYKKILPHNFMEGCRRRHHLDDSKQVLLITEHLDGTKVSRKCHEGCDYLSCPLICLHFP